MGWLLTEWMGRPEVVKKGRLRRKEGEINSKQQQQDRKHTTSKLQHSNVQRCPNNNIIRFHYHRTQQVSNENKKEETTKGPKKNSPKLNI